MPQDIMVEQKLFEVQAQNKVHMTLWSIHVCVCVHAEYTISDDITATI